MAGPERFLPPVARHWILAVTLAAVFVYQPTSVALLASSPPRGGYPEPGISCRFGMGAVDALTQLAHGPIRRRAHIDLPIIGGADWRDPAMVPMPPGDPKAVNITGLRVAKYTDNGIMAATPETVAAVRGPPPRSPRPAPRCKKTVPQGSSGPQTLYHTSQGGWPCLGASTLAASWHGGHTPLLRQRFDEARPLRWPSLPPCWKRWIGSAVPCSPLWNSMMSSCARRVPILPHPTAAETDACARVQLYQRLQPDRLAGGGGARGHIPRGLAHWRAGGGPPLAGGCGTRGGATSGAGARRLAASSALDVCFVSPAPVERHARVGGHPAPMALVSWIPAFAGMTRGHKDWQCIYEMDI